MENIQVERNNISGINMDQIQTNKQTDIHIEKMDGGSKVPPNMNHLPNSPKLFEVPKNGIELLENPSRKKENSMDFGGISEDNFEINIDDFNNVRKTVESTKPNLFDIMQKKDGSKDEPRRPSPNIFGPAAVRDRLRPNLGKETLNDLNFQSFDFSIDQNLGNDVKMSSMDGIDKNLGAGDMFENLDKTGGAAAASSAAPEQTDGSTDDLDKMNIDELLSECQTLKEKHGINTPQHFNRKTPTDEVRAFIRRERKKREKVNAEKLGAKILLTTITAFEFLNNKFDPFDLKLDGWSESIHENIDDYGEVFGELYEKYRTSAKVPPEIKLIMMVGGSAAMVHLTNTMFKSSLPGMEDMLKQNPEMMKQFAQAAQNQKFGMPPPQASQQQQPQQQPPPPMESRMPTRMAPPPQQSAPSVFSSQPAKAMNNPMMSSAALNRPIAPPGQNFGTGLEPMPRREMRGPSGLGVDDILKEIQMTSVKPPSPAKKSPNGSFVSKGTNQRRVINLNLK